MKSELSYCEVCKKETEHRWVETDDSWRRSGISDYVSGYYECIQCGTETHV
jgi:hypothetical protein